MTTIEFRNTTRGDAITLSCVTHCDRNDRPRFVANNNGGGNPWMTVETPKGDVTIFIDREQAAELAKEILASLNTQPEPEQAAAPVA